MINSPCRIKSFLLFLLVSLSSVGHAESVTTNTNAATLLNTIAGNGVIVSGEVLTATGISQSGTFTGFNFLFNNQMDDGIILGTGNVAAVVNGSPTTNSADDLSTIFNSAAVNDPDLGNGIFDPVKLTFNLTPEFDTLIFDFVFGSDEYNEYVYGGYNDKMRIIVNGADCALTPDGQALSIDSVNDAANFPPNTGAAVSSNPSLFINNDLQNGGVLASEMDGFTKLVSCRASVTPNVSIPVVVGISDDGDASYDSWVFFRAQSLRSEPSSDFGDAPDSYGTLLASGGPRHTVVEGVYMGTPATGDQNGFVDGVDDNAGAAADDTSDDGVAAFSVITDATTSYSVAVSATSINGNNSNLIGWIDFDGDGVFQADEASNITIVTNGTNSGATVLTWNNLGTSGPDIVAGNTYARFRITNDAVMATNTGGPFASGEVEDYLLTITDVTAPAVTTAPAPLATISNQAAYPVSGSCSTGDGNVTVSITGVGSQSVACSGGSWNAVFDVSAIVDGTDVIDINASQTDAAGNTGNAVLVAASMDATAPAVTTAPAPLATISNQTAYPVSGSCSAGDGNVTVSITGVGSQSVACSGGSWNAVFDVSAIADGTDVIDINASQTDAAGNTGNAVLVATSMDATAPAVTTAPAPLATISNQAAYPVNGSCNAGDGNVTVSIAGAVPGSQDVTCSTAGTWNAVFDVSAIVDGTDVIDINASQTDAAGNSGNAALIEADKDATAPAVPVVNSHTTYDVTPVITGTASVGVGEILTVTVGGATYTVVAVGTDWVLDTGIAVPDSGTFMPNTGGTNGLTTNEVIAVITDAAGNFSTDATNNELIIDVDTDDDGIPDAVEGPGDPDNDQTSNSQDLDSDGDGISDMLENGASGVDADGDGIDDTYDVDQTGGTDANGDGVDDNVIPRDTDLDGVPDYLDLDSDNDGIPDVVEGSVDTDMDGIPDYQDLDSDNDGIPDSVESGVSGQDDDGDGIDNTFDADADGDGNIDAGKADDNGDGIDDNAGQDTDGDGIPNNADYDSDNDGIPDVVEGAGDTDNDQIPDFLDFDSDNDGIPDSLEGNSTGVDTDGDGIDDAYDFDQSGGPDLDLDGIKDDEPDTDGDGIPDYQDLDSDNDDIPDVIESGASGIDTDSDGIDDAFDADADGDGDGSIDTGSVDANNDGIEDDSPLDSDGDTLADYRDIDSDDDGIPDTIEGGALGTDADGDGIDDAFDADADGDGNIDSGKSDMNSDGIDDWAETTDTDGDGTPNYLDIDTDNDGIEDSTEADTGLDSDGDGIDDVFDADVDGDSIIDVGKTDDDNDGIYDLIGATDTDGDLIPDYQDLDSDNDGIPDVTEAGLSDENQDGLLDVGGSTTTTPTDTDGDGIDDYRDVDSNNDGINDLEEAGNGFFDIDGDGMVDASADIDGDGIPDVIDGEPEQFGTALDLDGDGVANTIDLDDDNDGIPDSAETDANGNDVDTDGDGIIDRLDRDSDNDGIPDSNEASTLIVDADADGVIDNFIDTDGNGLDDSVDPNMIPVNTDGTGLADFRDLDSDDDGLTDLFEAAGLDNSLDSNNDGMVDSTADLDRDGLMDVIDTDVTDGASGTALQNADTDGDGAFDYRDTDSDNDGFDDFIENGDFNNNGIPDGYENTGALEIAVSGFGGGIGLAGLFMLLLVRILRAGIPSKKRVSVPVLLISLMLLPGSVIADNLCGRSSNEVDSNFQKCFYISGGLLASQV